MRVRMKLLLATCAASRRMSLCGCVLVQTRPPSKLGVGLAQHPQELWAQLVARPVRRGTERLGQASELVARLDGFGRAFYRLIQIVDGRGEHLAQSANSRVAALALPGAAHDIAQGAAQRLEFGGDLLPRGAG